METVMEVTSEKNIKEKLTPETKAEAKKLAEATAKKIKAEKAKKKAQDKKVADKAKADAKKAKEAEKKRKQALAKAKEIADRSPLQVSTRVAFKKAVKGKTIIRKKDSKEITDLTYINFEMPDKTKRECIEWKVDGKRGTSYLNIAYRFLAIK